MLMTSHEKTRASPLHASAVSGRETAPAGSGSFTTAIWMSSSVCSVTLPSALVMRRVSDFTRFAGIDSGLKSRRRWDFCEKGFSMPTGLMVARV